jgi:hypothetical protein
MEMPENDNKLKILSQQINRSGEVLPAISF